MPYLTEAQLDSTVDIPVCLPQTTLMPGDSIALATLQLVAPQQLTHQVMQIYVISTSLVNGLAGPPNPTLRIDVSRGLVFSCISTSAGVLGNNYTENASGTANDNLAVTPMSIVHPISSLVTAAGTPTPTVYTLSLTNNCGDSSITVVATGTIRVDLAP